VSVAAFAGLLIATHLHWPNWTLFVFALVASIMPSMPAMVRARWSAIYRDRPELQTAFAFESVADELVYMAGSILSVGLSVTLFPEAGPLASTIFLAVGTALFVIQKSTEPPVETVMSAGGTAFSFGAVKLLTFVLAAVGAIFGAAEVTVIALTREFGQPATASFILAGYAAGSLLVGLVYGALKLETPLGRQFMTAIAFMALMTLPLLFVANIPMLALALFLGGASISPTFITAFGLIERLVPAAKLTEGITWAMTGIGIGMAAGSFASGWAIDLYGAGSGFWVSVAAGGVAVAATFAGYCVLTARPIALRPAMA
jgi:hypothetical protein